MRKNNFVGKNNPNIKNQHLHQHQYQHQHFHQNQHENQHQNQYKHQHEHDHDQSTLISQKYDNYQYRLIQSKNLFWYLLNMQCLDRNVEMRFMVMNFTTSSGKYQQNHTFLHEYTQILTISCLLSIFQPIKQLSYINKQKLLCLKSKQSTTKNVPQFLMFIIHCMYFINNLNTHYLIQKKQTKINQEEIFLQLIQMIFGVKQAEGVFVKIIEYFNDQFEAKVNAMQQNYQNLFKFIELNQQIQIDFMNVKNNWNYDKIMIKDKQKYEKYDLDNNPNTSDMMNNSKNKRQHQLFYKLTAESFKVMYDCVKIYAAKSGKKVFRTKKSILINLPASSIFNDNVNKIKTEIVVKRKMMIIKGKYDKIMRIMMNGNNTNDFLIQNLNQIMTNLLQSKS